MRQRRPTAPVAGGPSRGSGRRSSFILRDTQEALWTTTLDDPCAAMWGPRFADSGQSSSNSDHVLSFWGQVRSTLVNLGPKLFGVGMHLTDAGPTFVDIGPVLVKIEQGWPKSECQRQAVLSRRSYELVRRHANTVDAPTEERTTTPAGAKQVVQSSPGQFGPRLGQLWSKLVELGQVDIGPTLTEIGPTSAEFGPDVGRKVSHIWPQLGRIRLVSPNFGQHRPGVGHIWAISTRFGPFLANMWGGGGSSGCATRFLLDEGGRDK